ncbi:hypothetical protein ACFQ51_44235 [Streptomyces kaempferi]
MGGTYGKPVTGLAFKGIQFSGTSWLGPSTDGYADQQNGLFIKGTYDYRPADAFTSCSRGCEMFERARTSWYQEPAAVQVSAASRISFTGNTFTNLGQSALGVGNDANATTTGVGLGASDIDVVGNRFMENSGHGIAVGGVLPDAHHPSDPRMTNRDILIADNTINRVAVDYKDNSGIFSTYVTNARILHNEVSNVPYDGIDTGYGWGINDAGGSNDYVDRGYYKWNALYTTPTTLRDNRVEGNLVHNTKARFADGGSVYNLSASPGTVVARNYLFNISGVGLYLDEGSRSMTYENNVVQGGSFLFTNAYSLRNNTSDNVIQNNWYNSGGASTPNAEAHNNKLINNVKAASVNWPAGARDVICQAGVAPKYRTSLNANQFGFSGCAVHAPVAPGLTTAGGSAVSSYFGQSGESFGIAAASADVWGSQRSTRRPVRIDLPGRFVSRRLERVHPGSVGQRRQRLGQVRGHGPQRHDQGGRVGRVCRRRGYRPQRRRVRVGQQRRRVPGHRRPRQRRHLPPHLGEAHPIRHLVQRLVLLRRCQLCPDRPARDIGLRSSEARRGHLLHVPRHRPISDQPVRLRRRSSRNDAVGASRMVDDGRSGVCSLARRQNGGSWTLAAGAREPQA